MLSSQLLCVLFVLGNRELLVTAEPPAKSASESTVKKPKGDQNAPPDPSALLESEELLKNVNDHVLELIVKIAEKPATWRQIHRVLETLEANNVAYSQRVGGNHVNEVNWPFKRANRPGDKRNDVPDDQPVQNGPTTTESSYHSIEFEFQRWRDALFASTANDDDLLSHPQYLISSSESTLTTERSKQLEHSTTAVWALSDIQPEQQRLEKKFEERLNDIEDELRRLGKLSRMLPSQVNRFKLNANSFKEKGRLKANSSELTKVTSEEAKKNGSTFSRPAHPKFHYHRVESKDLVNLDRLVGAEFWNRIALLKRNTTGVAKRNAIVAVSLAPSNVRHKDDNSTGHDNTMQATEPVHPVKVCKKKVHVGWKQKQRQHKVRQEVVGAKVEQFSRGQSIA